MNRNMILALLTVVLMSAAVLPLTAADESDAAVDNVDMTVYNSSASTMNRIGPVPGDEVNSWLWDGYYYHIISEVCIDSQVREYINGAGPEPASVDFDVLESNKDYYVYTTTNTGSSSGYECQSIERNPIDQIILTYGTYTITLHDSVGKPDSVSYASVHSLNGSSGGYYAYFDEECTIWAYNTQAYILSFYGSSGDKPVFKTKMNISPDPITITDGEATDPMSTSTVHRWYEGTVNANALVGLSGHDFLFPKGSEDENRFREQVIENRTIDFDPEDYNAITGVASLNGEYTLFHTGYRDDLYKEMILPISVLNENLEEKGKITVNITQLGDPMHTIYIGAFGKADITLSFDSELYDFYLIGKNIEIKVLSDRCYHFSTDSPMTLTVVPIPKEITDPEIMFTADFKMSVTGDVYQPEDDVTSVVLPLIGICAFVFILLFVSGFKPGWSKRK